ncbi:glycosyltransferase family 61 protein [Aeromicrobium sp.]|uniref:glycosyltransferase family 61 protein n=1 Tax=Aeromicrobium sp. TaxID=1871063 RepID=UPI0025C09E79|nr:glycosyltransferase family 61 protein [Aeromicrobium sp.]MCK5891550.1 glycosyltransferase family 61 protein [Aeromicrobium sp.]
MSKLPPRLQPLWPFAKRVHRLLTFAVGVVARRLRRLLGERAVPRGAVATVEGWAAHPDAGVVVHGLQPEAPLVREAPAGDPAGHWVFSRADRALVPPSFCLEVPGGTVVGDTGAVISRTGLLDAASSPYFGTASWREHPLFLRGCLPRVRRIEGDLLVLATRGSANYYHYLTDVLPRLGVYAEAVADPDPAPTILVPQGRGWQRTLLEIAGYGHLPVVEDAPDLAVRADRLFVPSIPNVLENAPASTVAWVREHLRPRPEADPRPRRLYVTRGTQPNSRRVVREAELWALLEARGFEKVEPGGLSPQEQIDVFSAAEMIVGPHGAALTNLLFAPAGVTVVELFTASYVNQCYWSISRSIPGAHYEYLVDGDAACHGPGSAMNAILADIEIDPVRVAATVDRLLAARHGA